MLSCKSSAKSGVVEQCSHLRQQQSGAKCGDSLQSADSNSDECDDYCLQEVKANSEREQVRGVCEGERKIDGEAGGDEE